MNVSNPHCSGKNTQLKQTHETKLETKRNHVSFTTFGHGPLAVNTGSNEPPIDGRSDGPGSTGPGSMGVESQEGSLYMTEERWQKIRIATEPWWLCFWPMIGPRRELFFGKVYNRFFLIITFKEIWETWIDSVVGSVCKNLAMDWMIETWWNLWKEKLFLWCMNLDLYESNTQQDVDCMRRWVVSFWYLAMELPGIAGGDMLGMFLIVFKRVPGSEKMNISKCQTSGCLLLQWDLLEFFGGLENDRCKEWCAYQYFAR